MQVKSAVGALEPIGKPGSLFVAPPAVLDVDQGQKSRHASRLEGRLYSSLT
jgi:hypothetical protein